LLIWEEDPLHVPILIIDPNHLLALLGHLHPCAPIADEHLAGRHLPVRPVAYHIRGELRPTRIRLDRRHQKCGEGYRDRCMLLPVHDS
jgi:hypothetical protein